MHRAGWAMWLFFQISSSVHIMHKWKPEQTVNRTGSMSTSDLEEAFWNCISAVMMAENYRKRVWSWTADSRSHKTLADPPTSSAFLLDIRSVPCSIMLAHIVQYCQSHASLLCERESCHLTRGRDRWNSCVWLVLSLQVLPVCKLAPEEIKWSHE